ncbi:hypothetical protein C825_000028 [Parabacteroides sp. ASF519]|nr:hypothetical protein C825_000028 [Parabacteroides sp. ASF519]
METELLTVQQSEEMQKTSGNPSPFSEEELKEFYLKFARLVNPNACSANRNDFEVLSILRKDLKKISEYFASIHSMPGMRECRKYKWLVVPIPYRIPYKRKNGWK